MDWAGEVRLWRITALLMVAATLALGQVLEEVQLSYLYTFGSKPGIHPSTFLSRRPAKVAFGEGEHPYGLGFPVAVTTDLQRRVWITDGGTASVHVFDRATGAYQEIRRTPDAQFQQPSGIVTDAQGRIYVTDSGNGGVYVFDQKGVYEHTLAKPGKGLLKSPGAIALSENGRTIYIADPPLNVVVALNREGEVDGTIALPPEFSEPSAISVVGNQIYVLGNRQHKVGIFSPNGHPRGELRWDGIDSPSAFTYDPERRRFLAANPQWMTVEVFSETGQGLGAFGQWGSGVDQMQSVDALHVDQQGLVYLVDSRRGKVLVFGASRHP